MTEQSDWDDENTQDNTTQKAPKALREAYEAMKVQNETLAKQVKDLAEKDRVREVEAKLSSKGLPAGAADLFPKDVSPTDDEVTKWVGQYGGLFGSPTPVEPTVEPTQESVQPDQTFLLASQLEQMQKVSQSAPAAGPKNDLTAMLQNPHLVDEVPFEDFLAAMRSVGAKV